MGTWLGGQVVMRACSYVSCGPVIIGRREHGHLGMWSRGHVVMWSFGHVCLAYGSSIHLVMVIWSSGHVFLLALLYFMCSLSQVAL